VAREKADRDYRIKQYTEDMNRLYARYLDLDAQKKMLQDRLDALAQSR
jgi:lipid II:glycine glycyltransferase (peptidoglycan interpeptide bridge formation enzyme)